MDRFGVFSTLGMPNFLVGPMAKITYKMIPCGDSDSYSHCNFDGESFQLSV